MFVWARVATAPVPEAVPADLREHVEPVLDGGEVVSYRLRTLAPTPADLAGEDFSEHANAIAERFATWKALFAWSRPVGTVDLLAALAGVLQRPADLIGLQLLQRTLLASRVDAADVRAVAAEARKAQAWLQTSSASTTAVALLDEDGTVLRYFLPGSGPVAQGPSLKVELDALRGLRVRLGEEEPRAITGWQLHLQSMTAPVSLRLRGGEHIAISGADAAALTRLAPGSTQVSVRLSVPAAQAAAPILTALTEAAQVAAGHGTGISLERTAFGPAPQ